MARLSESLPDLVLSVGPTLAPRQLAEDNFPLWAGGPKGSYLLLLARSFQASASPSAAQLWPHYQGTEFEWGQGGDEEKQLLSGPLGGMSPGQAVKDSSAHSISSL